MLIKMFVDDSYMLICNQIQENEITSQYKVWKSRTAYTCLFVMTSLSLVRTYQRLGETPCLNSQR